MHMKKVIIDHPRLIFLLLHLAQWTIVYLQSSITKGIQQQQPVNKKRAPAQM